MALTRLRTGGIAPGALEFIPSLTVGENITVNSQGDVRLSDADSSNFVAIQAPANVASNLTFTLPGTDGSNGQVIQTNGSGALSFATSSSLTGTTDSASPFETSLGTGAGAANTGGENTFIGFDAGNDNTSGVRNTAIGTNALATVTTANENTAVGFNALAVSTVGDSVAVGSSALQANTTGAENTALGAGALKANTTAANNTAVGRSTLNVNTTGANNTAVGREALLSNTTGSANTAVGSGALDACTTVNNNTAVGARSVTANTTGPNNTGIGADALGSTTTGSTNTALGDAAGFNVTTGGNNLFLGGGAGRTGSPSGEVTTGSNIVCLGNNSITDLFCADTTISSSDARDKTDVQEFTHGLDWITQLRPVTYRWDKRSWYVGENATTEDVLNAQPDGSKKRTRLNLGFLAQEEIAVEQQFGFGNTREDMLVASENGDGSAYGLKYERLVPILVNAIKELKAEVTALQAEVNTLKGQP